MGHGTYYEILEVRPAATQDEIKAAFRRLARRHHPDQNPDGDDESERFKAIAEAYAVLSDARLRSAYDRFGIAPAGAAFGGHRATSTVDTGFTEFVKTVATAARRVLRARRGTDLTLDVSLEFAQAVIGCRRILELPRLGPDLTTVEMRRLSFDLPPGLRDGQVLRWPGEGAPGEFGGRSGDLFLRISVKPHPVLRLGGSDIIAELPLTLGELVEGAKVEVPTLSGTDTLTVPAGTQPGDALRLPGAGAPTDPPGDAVFVVSLYLPESLDDDARRHAEAVYSQAGARPADFQAALAECRDKNSK